MEYRAEDFTATLAAADYVARFRDAERFAGCCRACSNYGRSWACPPFGYDPGELLARYARVLIVVTKITPLRSGMALREAQRLIRPERVRHERRLLEMERAYGGRSLAYSGTCLYCPEGSCTRPLGLPCRHPGQVRPSLEAFGFDVGATASELLGIPILWGRDGLMPAYLTLVSGFFHNEKDAVWNG